LPVVAPVGVRFDARGSEAMRHCVATGGAHDRVSWGMKERFFAIGASVAVSLAVVAAPRPRPVDWAQPVLGTTLGNFFQVSPDLFRAGQPDAGDVTDLKALGIRSILNLRDLHNDAAVKGFSQFQLSRVAMEADDVNREQVLQALRVIRDAPKPLLVHCWHGSDRTGVTVAAYRIVFQQWSNQRAIDELKNGGFGYHAKLYRNLVTLLEGIDARQWRAELGLP
jgi:tyrosine-protein phosphatase SIW14